MNQTTAPQWQAQAVKDLDQAHTPRLRMSSAGKCTRRLAYAHTGTPESNPPNQQAENRMAMGHMAEILIIRNLEQAGWEINNTVLTEGGQLELNMELLTASGKTVHYTGHPDGICRHPEFTNNLWVAFEAKSMSPDRADLTEEHGVAVTYPDYIVQIGLYGRILYQDGLVSHPNRGVFGMMDREGRPIAPQRVRWEDDTIENAIQSNTNAINATENGELPERPHEINSFECTNCPYRNLCWGQEPDPNRPIAKRPKIVPEDQEVLHAMRDWADMEPRMTEIKAVLEAASREADNADLVTDRVTAGYFTPMDPPEYNPHRLKELVPDDILKRCRIPSAKASSRFWIRKPRY